MYVYGQLSAIKDCVIIINTILKTNEFSVVFFKLIIICDIVLCYNYSAVHLFENNKHLLKLHEVLYY